MKNQILNKRKNENTSESSNEINIYMQSEKPDRDVFLSKNLNFTFYFSASRDEALFEVSDFGCVCFSLTFY